MQRKYLAILVAVLCGAALFFSLDSASAVSCTNPSPIPNGYAAPCPVLSLSSYSITSSGPLSLSLTPNASPQYIWGTAYLYNGSSWEPIVISSNYITATTNYTIPSSDISPLGAGNYYLASWDWTWNQSLGCYVGPGSTTCNTGDWRVQEFSVTGGGGGGGGGNYSLTNQQPPSMPAYYENPDSVTTKPLPSDIMQHLLGNTSNGASSDAMAKCALTDCGQFNDTNGTYHLGMFTKASPGTDDLGNPTYYSSPTDPYYELASAAGANGTKVTNVIFRAPNAAQFSEGSSDEYITIWDQSTGWVVQIYGGSGGGSNKFPAVSGGCGTFSNPCMLPAYDGYYSAATNMFTGADYHYETKPPSAGGFAPEAGMLREQELLNGTVNHALLFTVDCVNSAAPYVFPAYNYPELCPNTAGGGFGAQSPNRPSAGTLLFTDYTPAQIASFHLPAWQTTLLTTMGTYGAYVTETGGMYTGMSLGGDENIESSQAWAYYGDNPLTSDAIWSYLNSQNGLAGNGNITQAGCTGANGTSLMVCEGAILGNIPRALGPEGTDAEGNSCTTGLGCYASGHLHVADPCIAKQYAGVGGGCS